MSKKDDRIMDTEDDSEAMPEPEPAPAREISSDVPPGAPPPRVARFGEGGEGSGGRRERGLTGARAGFFTRIGQFVRDTRAELRRVSWPSANEVKNTTLITIAAVIFFAAYLYGVDKLWTFLIAQLVRFANWLTGNI